MQRNAVAAFEGFPITGRTQYSGRHRWIICKPCIGVKDTACITVCPVDCIHPRSDEPGFEQAEQLFIEPDVCIDCGHCAEECPVQAIFQEDDVPLEWGEFIEQNRAHYVKKEEH